MKVKMQWFCWIFLFVLSCVSCKKDYQTFEYTFTMENVSNYKMMFSFDNEKNFRTEVQNYFMDRWAHTSNPKIRTGVLTDEQYAHLYSLLKDSDLFAMEDQYGFEEGTVDEEGILTQIMFTADGETKYVSIRNLSRQKFGRSFRELLKESVASFD